MKSLNILLISIFSLIMICQHAVAQEDESEKRPERAAFESALLIDNQTGIIPAKNTLEFDLSHRFGTLENGKSDLWGIYAPGSNTRMGLTFSLRDNLALGVGFTKLNKFVDFNLKYRLLQQTRDGSMPISMTYFGNTTIDGREEAFFETSENEGIHRLSFFNQLIIDSRFNKKVSIQLSPSFSYFNKVDFGMNNYIIGMGLGGRYKISPQSSLLIDLNQQLTQHDEVVDLQPNIGLGWEVSTSTHKFQIFVSTFKGLLPQYNMVFNENEFNSTGILVGFNMSSLWNL